MWFDGSPVQRKELNYGRKGNGDERRGSQFIAAVQQERKMRQLEKQKQESAKKIWGWYKHQKSINENLTNEREKLLADTQTSLINHQISASQVMSFLERFIILYRPLSRREIFASYLQDDMHIATRTILALSKIVVSQLIDKLDLVNCLLPKKNPAEDQVACRNKWRIGLLLHWALQLVSTRCNVVRRCNTSLRLMLCLTDCKAWKLYNVAPIPAVRHALESLSAEFMRHLITSKSPPCCLTLKKLLELYSNQSNSTTKASTIVDAAFTLLIRAALVGVHKVDHEGINLLSDVISIPHLFRLLPPISKKLWKDNAVFIIDAILSDIRGLPIRNDSLGSFEETELEGEEPETIEPRMFLLANLVDFYLEVPNLPETPKWSLFSAWKRILESAQVYKDAEYTLMPILPQIKVLYSRDVVETLLADIFDGSVINKPTAKQTLARVYQACDFFCTLLIKLPLLSNEILMSLAQAKSKKVVMCLWLFFKTFDGVQCISRTRDSQGDMKYHLRILTLFCYIYSRLLTVLDDDEFYEVQLPLHLDEVVLLIKALKKFIFDTYSSNVPSPSPDVAFFCTVAGRLLHQLHERHTRRPITREDIWSIPELQRMCSKYHDYKVQSLVFRLPFATSFVSRYNLFRSLLAYDKQSLGMDLYANAAPLMIRRGHIAEDGYARVMQLSTENLKLNFVITFVGTDGLKEEGIDGGGLFKEFLNDLLKETFDPDFGLFSQTDQYQLYPNPKAIHEKFLGRMLGKAVYEGIVVDLPFARFFLKKILAQQPTLDDLSSLDAQLYKNLVHLKYMTDNVEELDLTFSIEEDAGDRKITKPFFYKGETIPVTSANRIDYIHYMADYKLNKQIQSQTTAFLFGFRELIPTTWLRLFDANELQILISGDSKQIDVDDLERNTIYSGYTASDRTIKLFWEVVRNFTDEQQRALIKFVTSCSRPPMLGFSNLRPPFTIGVLETDSHADLYLPTAQTCVNLLRLPRYSTKGALKTKLLIAITSKSGFEMQ